MRTPVGTLDGMERPTEPFFDLRRYGAVLRRRRRWFLGAAAITVALSLGYWFLRPATYVATAEVLVRPVRVDPRAFSAPALSLETEAAIVRSTAVSEIAADHVGPAAQPDQIVQGVSVEIPAETQTLDVSYSAATPAAAQRGAQAFADAYLEVRAGQVRAEIDRVTAAYDEEIGRLQAQLAEANQTVAENVPGSSEARTAAALQDLLGDQIATLSAQRAVVSTTDVDPGEVIVRPTLPDAPQGPGLPLTVAMGVVLGLFVGTLAALSREWMGDPLGGRADVEKRIRAPVLAVIPRVPRWRDARSPLLVSVGEPASAVAEAYRALRADLLAPKRKGKKATPEAAKSTSLLVLSPLAGEGKTTTAANLGVVVAQAGRRVLVVSADLRRPRLHEFFQAANRRGLPMVLSGQPLEQHVRRVTGIPNLWFLPSGPPSGVPSESIKPENVRHLLNQARREFDLVIVDCPPLLPVADSRLLASVVDGVLLVVDPDRTGRSVLSQTAGELDRLGVPVVGAVLNNIDPATARPDYLTYEHPSNGRVSARTAPRVRSR